MRWVQHVISADDAGFSRYTVSGTNVCNKHQNIELLYVPSCYTTGPEKDAVPGSEGGGGCRRAVQSGGNREGLWMDAIDKSSKSVKGTPQKSTAVINNRVAIRAVSSRLVVEGEHNIQNLVVVCTQGNACFFGQAWVLITMVWYGMVWYGMVWYGMVWYGMVWYGMVW